MFLSCICLQDPDFEIDGANQAEKKFKKNNKFSNKRIKLDKYEMGTIDLSCKDTTLDDGLSYDMFSQKLLNDVECMLSIEIFNLF